MNTVAFLFDLDGTLLDTADDLVAALNHVRGLEGAAPLAPEPLRRYASRGARGLLEAGMPAAVDEPQQQQRLQAFLDYYALHQRVHTRPYDGVEQVLQWLEESRIPWGIVTNKLEWLALPLVRDIGWDQRARCVVCGDTTAQAKPHPLPVQFALERLGVEPGHTWMVGDDERDIRAGHAAGCATAAAAWGYLGPDTIVEMLGADVILRQPADIPSLMRASGRAAAAGTP